MSADNFSAKLALRREQLLFIVTSALVLIPCFWHRRIQAGDLASHMYNAWLAQLVREGKAPGVYVVWQWKNVLFDWMVSAAGRVFGWAAAEKICVSLCVLVFFWGAFRLAEATSGCRPWLLTPGLAMLAYGYVFELGFMNYYLSLGLACFGLAALWNGSRKGIAVAALLAPVALLAHPLGFLWLVGAGVYRLVWPKLRGWLEFAPPVAAAGCSLLVLWYVKAHPALQPDWDEGPFYQRNGFDQLWIFRPETRWVMFAAIAFALVATVADFWSRRREQNGGARERRLLLELYAIACVWTMTLPEDLRPDPDAGWIGLLATRLTLISAIFAFCWLATLRPRAWHALALGACAATFFPFIYLDTAQMQKMEDNAESITKTLPSGTRVLATVNEPADYRLATLHVVDRACVGRCFLYSNYEPSTKQFRVRSQAGSPVVTASTDDSEDMQAGVYEIEDEDLPLKEVYQCDANDWTRLCIRDLKAGERNGAGNQNP